MNLWDMPLRKSTGATSKISVSLLECRVISRLVMRLGGELYSPFHQDHANADWAVWVNDIERHDVDDFLVVTKWICN